MHAAMTAAAAVSEGTGRLPPHPHAMPDDVSTLSSTRFKFWSHNAYYLIVWKAFWAVLFICWKGMSVLDTFLGIYPVTSMGNLYWHLSGVKVLFFIFCTFVSIPLLF